MIVVGAGPGGSATAAYLAMTGLDVLLLEKTAFPREKVCGDGLTPRAVRELITLGVPTPEEDGWIRNHGLRIIGGGMRLSLPWPDLASFPPYGLVRTRQDFDDILARHAVKHGARLRERTNVTGPVLDDRTGAIVGVTAKLVDDDGRPTGAEVDVPGAAGRGRRRQLQPPVAVDGPAQARRPADGRRRAHLLHEPAPRRRLPRVVAGAVEHATRRGRRSCCPATAGSSASATAPATSAWASSTPPRPSARSTTRTCCSAGSRPCPRSGPTTSPR